MELAAHQPNLNEPQYQRLAWWDQHLRAEIFLLLNCRCFSDKLHDQSHTIYKLAIHLSNQQRVFYRERQQEQAAERAEGRDTHLSALFRLNREDLTARQFLYSDIPKHYVFIDRRSGQSEEEVVTESSAGCSQSAPEIPRSFTCVSSFYVLCQEPQALMTWRQLTVPFQVVSEKRAFKGVSSQMIQRTITRWQ